jgi:hypothetical protein
MAAQTYPVIGGHGRCVGKIRDQAPGNLELPKFNTDKPLFCLWKASLGEAKHPDGNARGAWLALDCSRKGGPYDLLYIDSDFDGSLADEQPIKAEKQPEGYPPEYAVSKFIPVKVVLPWKTGPRAYHMEVRFIDYPYGRGLVFELACWYEGPVTLDGRELWCTLIDDNCNGAFNDSSSEWWTADRIRLAPRGDRSFDNPESDRTTRRVGQHVEVDGKLYQLDISPDGAFVEFAPAGEVPTGTVRVAADVDDITLSGKQGMFDRRPKDGLFAVPTGEYGLVRWNKTKTDDKGLKWRLLGLSSQAPDHRDLVKVTEGQETALGAGGPIESLVRAQNYGGQWQLTQELKGSLGERISLLRNGQRAAAPQVRIINSDGSYDKKFSMEYG